MLSETERFLLSEAVRDWALRAPEPTQPVIAFPGYGYLTAASLTLAVDQRSPVGEAYLQIIEHNVRRTSLEEVLEKFRNDPGALPPGTPVPHSVGPFGTAEPPQVEI
jgi:hypothetical protein